MKKMLVYLLVVVIFITSNIGFAATKGEQNALSTALLYLDIMTFSYSRLIEQLEYEGFSESECKYAADNCGADWFEQAAGCAENYLSLMSLSKSRLIEQLEYEGFSKEEAQYGAAVAYGENPVKQGSNGRIKKQSEQQKQTDENKADNPPVAEENNTNQILVDSSNFDLSNLSYAELIELYSEIQVEIMSRPEFKSVLVPTGAYKVGVDIPAGKWTITASEGMCEVYWGKALDEYGIEIPSSSRIAKLDDWGSKSSVTWNLTEGTFIVVNRKAVTFTPYIAANLGF